MFDSFRAGFQEELDAIREAGTYKEERVISPTPPVLDRLAAL